MGEKAWSAAVSVFVVGVLALLIGALLTVGAIGDMGDADHRERNVETCAQVAESIEGFRRCATEVTR